MTPREIILANLEHANPDRPGMGFSGDRMNDFTGCGMGPSSTYTPKRWVEGKFEYYDDEWGNLWRRMKEGCKGGEVVKPAIEDWSQLDQLRLPDFDDPARFEQAREILSQPSDKFKLVGLPGWVFASSRYLRTMEIYFMDLIEYREEIDRLHERVTDLLARVIERFADAGAEGFIFCEDLGVQDRTLISPAMWRDIFKPHYEKLVGIAHSRGLKVFMHSCGYNWDLIDDLAGVGIDCFQFDQPANYDMPALAAKFREHKVALYSPVDIQKVLPTGDRAFIEAEARRMVDTFRGCLICKNYGDLPGIGVKDE